MSRRCTKCPTSSMPNGARHLHELDPGACFRFPDSPDRWRLLDLTEARGSIVRDTGGPASPCAAVATVEPVE